MVSGKRLFVIAISTILMLAGLAGCSKAYMATPPFVPAQYYDCLEVSPYQLVDIYFSNYANITMSEAQYNGHMFVFKNIRIEDWMLAHLDEGWIWVDQIRCSLSSYFDWGILKAGNRVDVVGMNMGVRSYERPGLAFEDCIVLPAGVVSLPADPGTGPIVPGY